MYCQWEIFFLDYIPSLRPPFPSIDFTSYYTHFGSSESLSIVQKAIQMQWEEASQQSEKEQTRRLFLKPVQACICFTQISARHKDNDCFYVLCEEHKSGALWSFSLCKKLQHVCIFLYRKKNLTPDLWCVRGTQTTMDFCVPLQRYCYIIIIIFFY